MSSRPSLLLHALCPGVTKQGSDSLAFPGPALTDPGDVCWAPSAGRGTFGCSAGTWRGPTNVPVRLLSMSIRREWRMWDRDRALTPAGGDTTVP